MNKLRTRGEGKGVVFGCIGRCQSWRCQGVHHLRIVETGHQQPTAAGILDHYERGVGDVQRGLVVAFGVLVIKTEVLQCQIRGCALPGTAGKLRICGGGGEIIKVVLHALDLHIVRVKTVLTGTKVGRLGIILWQRIILCTRLTGIEITHLSVNVEVGPQIPLHVFGNGVRQSRFDP